MGHAVTVSERAGGKYTQDVTARSHHFYADEPEKLGSADLGPTPFELLAASLAACTSITLRMYADRKNWPAEHIAVDVRHKVSTEAGSGEKTNVFERTLHIKGDLDDDQRARMLEIANKCPVHKVLESQNEIRTMLN